LQIIALVFVCYIAIFFVAFYLLRFSSFYLQSRFNIAQKKVTFKINTAINLAQLYRKSRIFNFQKLKKFITKVKALKNIAKLKNRFKI
jgi:peptidyl-tRNA hydrolase